VRPTTLDHNGLLSEKEGQHWSAFIDLPTEIHLNSLQSLRMEDLLKFILKFSDKQVNCVLLSNPECENGG
jgi:hypothetical protein